MLKTPTTVRASESIAPVWHTSKARAAADHNANLAKLLQLPPELRSRIFALVVGCKNIYVARCFNPFGTMPHLSLCVHPEMLQDVLTTALFDPAVDSTLATDGHRCKLGSVGTAPKIGVDLALLQDCTRIYLEARLLPFATNFSPANQ